MSFLPNRDNVIEQFTDCYWSLYMKESWGITTKCSFTSPEKQWLDNWVMAYCELVETDKTLTIS